jgi:hypothetical protein
MARIEEIRVDPWHPWFIFFLGCGFAALTILRFNPFPVLARKLKVSAF